jgi:hypothetical protein
MSSLEEELMALKEKYGFDALKNVAKNVIGVDSSKGISSEFREACPSIAKLEDLGYNFYVMSSNFQSLCQKEGIELSREEVNKFNALQRQNLVVGRFWKSKKNTVENKAEGENVSDAKAEGENVSK